MLAVQNLTHRYGDEAAVEDTSFEVGEGELVAVLGPSGCGKTTLVRAIAGHVRPTAGRVVLRGEDVTDAPPETRRVSVVFQQSTLYPHMTVGENVAYGLKARGVDSAQRTERVAEYLDLVSLGGQRESRPAELSGGQQRRAELARALAPQPDVLLLDEPLSALDRSLRDRLRDEIARIQRETGVTTLFVTHDQTDAMAVADRLVVMNDGSIAGSGRPRALYESPPTPFVASFLGRSNALPATVVGSRPLPVSVGGQELTVSESEAAVPETERATCHVRPEQLSIAGPGDDDADLTLQGTVTRVRDTGRRYDVTVDIGTDGGLLVEVLTDPPAVGDAVTVAFSADALTLFPDEAE